METCYERDMMRAIFLISSNDLTTNLTWRLRRTREKAYLLEGPC